MKLCRANERVSELTDELSEGQLTLAQLHATAAESSRQLSAAETTRDTAQEQAQTCQEAAAKAEAERETSRKWAQEQLAGLWVSRNGEREEHAQKRAELQHQLGAAQKQAAALQVRLEQAERTVREQRDQLDDTALALIGAVSLPSRRPMPSSSRRLRPQPLRRRRSWSPSRESCRPPAKNAPP